jgi:hypothetical protein
VYVVVADRPDVAPVAVIVLAPPVVSATVVADPVVHEPNAVVVHADEAEVHIVVVTDTDSAAPKPESAIDGVIDCSGKPKLLPVKVTETFGVMVYDVLTLVVPSLTTMVSAPPGRAGTVADTWKVPDAVVVRQPPLIRLFAEPVPLFVNVANGEAQAAAVSHATVVEPTRVVIAIGFAPRKPVPVMTRVDATVPDVAAVWTPLVIVDRVTPPTAWAGVAGSRKTIPAIPARNSRPTVPKEASLLFGVICICILFTYFRNFKVPD